MDEILAPISTGELMDKVTILEIKSERITNPVQQANVARELAALRTIAARLELDSLKTSVASLKRINTELWDVEDGIRACEAHADFGPHFIDLARAVYRLNDERARIKRAICEISGSRYVEEKSYWSGSNADVKARPG